MIHIQITLNHNHIKTLIVKGHASSFPTAIFDKKYLLKANLPKIKKKDIDPMKNMGNVPCAAVSVLCKSFLESVALYCIQKKESLDSYMNVFHNDEGHVHVEFTLPTNDLLEIHRFAIEQMLILGLQSVSREYPLEIDLRIG